MRNDSMQYDLKKFKVLNLDAENCFVTVTLNCVIFSSALVEKLNNPLFVKVLIDEEDRCLAIIKSKLKTPETIDFCSPYGMQTGIRLNNRGFAKKLRTMAGISETVAFRVYGDYLPDYDGFAFDLKKAKIVVQIQG